MLCRKNIYDGKMEYWVEIRVTGTEGYAETETETRTDTKTVEKDDEAKLNTVIGIPLLFFIFFATCFL